MKHKLWSMDHFWQLLLSNFDHSIHSIHCIYSHQTIHFLKIYGIRHWINGQWPNTFCSMLSMVNVPIYLFRNVTNGYIYPFSLGFNEMFPVLNNGNGNWIGNCNRHSCVKCQMIFIWLGFRCADVGGKEEGGGLRMDMI